MANEPVPAAADPDNPTPGSTGPKAGSEPVRDNLDWRAALPDEIRNEKVFESIKGKDWTEAGPILAKNYVHAEKRLGGSLKIPGADAKPEEIAAFRAKLGVPEAPDKYEIKVPTAKVTDEAGAEKDVPVWDPKLVDGFRTLAYRIGLSNSQAAALVDYYQGTLGNISAFVEELTVKTEEALRADWGAAYDHKLARAQRAVEIVGGPTVLAKLERSGLGSDPDFIRMFEKLGREMAEDGAILEDGEGPVGPVAAQAEIAALMAQKKDEPFWNADHPDHKKTVERYRELNTIAYS